MWGFLDTYGRQGELCPASLRNHISGTVLVLSVFCVASGYSPGKGHQCMCYISDIKWKL